MQWLLASSALGCAARHAHQVVTGTAEATFNQHDIDGNGRLNKRSVPAELSAVSSEPSVDPRCGREYDEAVGNLRDEV
jgi:hypothetical protein